MTTPSTISIALDAMGGDHAPREAVHAAASISKTTDLELQLVGDPDAIARELDGVEHDRRRLHIVPAGSVIGMAEKPSDALRAKPDASVAIAAQRVGSGEADALVSAGSTGALVLAAAKHIPRIPGVRKTALAAVYPTRERARNPDRFALILDVGATVRCDPRDLLLFAHMGHAYASGISRVPHPSIALLNIGTEESKGDAVLTEAHQLLRADERLRFIGNVEGTDLPRGVADVIVCEGLVGNVVLKMAEGFGELMQGLGAWAFKQSVTWRLGLLLLSSGLKQLKNVTDYREYGGAPFLGFERMVIKAHGRSSAHAIANAIKVAAKSVRSDVCGRITAATAPYAEPGETAR